MTAWTLSHTARRLGISRREGMKRKGRSVLLEKKGRSVYIFPTLSSEGGSLSYTYYSNIFIQEVQGKFSALYPSTI